MNCETFEQQLNDRLDSRQECWDGDLHAHSEVCERCADLLAAHQCLLGVLRQAEAPEPDGDFTDNVLRAVLGPPLASPRSVAPVVSCAWSRPQATVLAATLAVLASVVVAAFLFRQPPAALAPIVVAPPAPGFRPQRIIAMPPTLQEKDLPPSHQPATATLSSAEPSPETIPAEADLPSTVSTGQIARGESSDDYREWLRSWRQNLPDSPLATPFESPQLPPGLRPIANSLGSAIYLLRSTLPGGRTSTEPEKPQAFYRSLPHETWA
ncbi:hypothetical protein [Lignipirellula cremea]|uniref:Zinc-finger domain-containing protein n=1 Tax=Lignipirellula cremea TaxID=2528010 RepID=A0A518DZQ4_9BACT|nr:hypothetical protein [Lignipirellula cremea]QDU97291.1 hypothetical protein Pla8534_51370 [Lignipirellula cremea]